MYKAFATLLLLAPVAAAAADPGACDIRYELAARWKENPRRFDVTLTFDAGARVTTHLRATESFGGVTNFDEALRNLKATTLGASIAADPAPKRWTVTHGAGQRVAVTYQALSGVANVDAGTPIDHRAMYRNQLGESYFSAFGHGLFLVPEEAASPGSRYCITFSDLPGGWSMVSSFGADQEPGAANYATTAGHDAIRHALFLGGDFRVTRRDIEGRPLYVAIRGSWSFEDAKFVDATAALIGAQRRFFGDFDYPHFLVSLVPNHVERGSTGGTAVHNAFAMHASKDFTVPGDSFAYLIGHEHLHTWIPARIGTQGGDAEEPGRYWFSEGFTDYLTHRLLLRSGAWRLEDYAASLNRVVEGYLTSPERGAPGERIAKEFWSNREVGRIPYLRGELLALRWDAALRRNGTALDAVLRSLILPREKLPPRASNDPRDLAVSRLAAALAPRLGSGLDSDLAAFVGRGETIPIGGDFLGPCFEARSESKPRFQLGFDSASITAKRIRNVVPGSAAEHAGLRDGMELVGWSIHFGDATQDVTLQVLDDNRMREFSYRPVTAQAVEVPVFAPRPDASGDPACRASMAGD